MLNIHGTAKKSNPIDPDIYGKWSQLIAKPEENFESIEVGEPIRSETTIFPVSDEFLVDPEYSPLLMNPYGGISGTAIQTLSYNGISDSLNAYILAGSSEVSLGCPSLAWQTSFPDPTSFDFIPQKIELEISWSVENLNYESSDNLSVMVRIDDQYIDGTKDIYGNTYNNATTTSIENSINNDQYLDHSTVTRVFDVTDLISFSTNNHTLDFGIWLNNIDETDDSVRVKFEKIQIRAVEYTQYKIGDLSFKCDIDLETEPGTIDTLLLYYELSNATTNTLIPIQKFNEIFDGPVDSKVINLNLTSNLLDILNSNQFSFSLGVLNTQKYILAESDPISVSFDDLSFSPYYSTQDFSGIGLQIYNGSEWVDIDSSNLKLPNPQSGNIINASFHVSNGVYSDSFLKFQSNLFISRISTENATASYYIDENIISNSNLIFWDVSYNSSITYSEFLSDNSINFNFSLFNFSIIDLPAWDQKGSTSEDWLFTGFKTPTQIIPESLIYIRSNGSNNNSNFQNISITNVIGKDFFDNFDGISNITFNSKNYLSNITLLVDDIPTNKVYNGNFTEINVNLSISEIISGNFEILIKNATNSTLLSFPQYFINEGGNVSLDWSVLKEGLGQYQIIANWNDSTPIGGQISRIGFWKYDFEVWNTLSGDLLEEPPSLISSEVGSFYLNVSDIDNNPISNIESFIFLNNNATDQRWGVDWPPFQYLVSDVYENNTAISYGNYTLEFQTYFIPIGVYEVFISIEVPYYEAFQIQSTINITGTTIYISYLTGVIKSNEYEGFLEESFIPILNDSSPPFIDIYIEDEYNNPLEDGLISGKFNGTENVFFGIERYEYTSNVGDLGIYEIFLNTTALNASNIERSIYNYSLTLTYSIPGFSSTSFNISTPILPVKTFITFFDLDPVYEGESVNLLVTFKTNSTEYLIPNTNLYWRLSNSSSSLILQGTFNYIIDIVYQSSIDFEDFIKPGFYNLTIEASKFNYANATKVQVNLEILPKNATILTLAVNNNFQIGSNLEIQAKLEYFNNSLINNKEIIFTIFYNDILSISANYFTDNFGIAKIFHTIPYTYEGYNLSIYVKYNGDDYTNPSSDSIINISINGKNEANLTFSQISNTKVGYSPLIEGFLQIEGVDSYLGKEITFAAWYDDNQFQYIIIIQVSLNQTGNFSILSPEIADNHSKITFFVDYSGSLIDKYCSMNINFSLSEKWDFYCELNVLSDQIRYGEIIDAQISGIFLDENCTESLYGELLRIRIIFSSRIFEFDYFFTNLDQIFFDFHIPINAEKNFSISLIFDGTNRILQRNFIYYYSILPKIPTFLVLLNDPPTEDISNDFFISVSLQDFDGNKIKGQEIIFILKSGSQTLNNYSVITNQEGIASINIILNSSGIYTVEYFYSAASFYESSFQNEELSYHYLTKIEFYILNNIYLIGGIILASSILSFIGYKTIFVPKKRKKLRKILDIHSLISDVENLQYLFVINKENGLNLFTHTFANLSINENLISGFLSAIITFGNEIGGKVKSYVTPTDSYGELKELAYQQFKIVMIEGKKVRSALLLLKPSSDTLKKKLLFLIINLKK